MLETAGREIRRAAEAAERRRREARRMPDLVAALDAVLFELEELNVRRVAVAPASCRQRVAELVADAGRLDAAPELPELVTAIMERVFEAQELAVLRRRRAGWGIEETPAGGAARSR